MKWGVLLVLVWAVACASVAPVRPRFVTVFEQKHEVCRLQVIQDTRTQACFVVLQCRRQPVQLVPVDDSVCVP